MLLLNDERNIFKLTTDKNFETIIQKPKLVIELFNKDIVDIVGAGDGVGEMSAGEILIRSDAGIIWIVDVEAARP